MPLFSLSSHKDQEPLLRFDSFFRWTPGLPGTLSLGGGIGRAGGFLFAIAVTLVAAVLNRIAPHGLHDPLYIDFLVAVLATELVAGMGPALLAIGLSLAYLFDLGLSPGAVGISGYPDRFRLLNFVLAALVVLALNTRSMLLKWQAGRWRKKFLAIDGARSGMTLFEWDLERDEIVWSERLAVLRDLQPGESYRDRVPDEDRERIESALEASARSGDGFDVRYRVRGPEGDEHWLVVTGQFLKGRRRCRWVIGTISDVTELVQVHERLRSNEHHFELAQKMTLMATWEWQTGSSSLQWSSGSGPVFGLPDQGFQLSVEDFYQSVHPQDRERLRRLFETGCIDQQDYEAEFRYYWPDGSLHWLFTRARAVLDENGLVCRVVGVTLEITARKRAEDALRASERLAANGRLAATLAHEINNPLNSLRSVLYLLDYHAGESPLVRRYIEMGQREIVHAAAIIRQTLGLYREPQGAIAASPRQEIEQVLAMYQARARRERVEIDARLEFDGTIPVLPGEIRQIVTNLLLNAIDAGARRLRIHLYLSHASDAGPQRTLRLVVADDGSGIPSAAMPRLFDAFYTTKGEKGTGLGLWVICNITRKYGGSIDVRSSQNTGWRGTTFMIRLPIESPPITPVVSSDAQSEQPSEAREAWSIGPASVTADTDAHPGAA